MKNFQFVVCSCVLAAIVGCGGDAADAPDLHPASGKAMLGSQPAANIVITVVPSDPKLPRSTATVNEDGTFELVATANQAGAVAGTHKVVLAFVSGEDAYSNPGSGPPKAPFDNSYLDAATTPLEVVIPEGGDTNLTIQIPNI